MDRLAKYAADIISAAAKSPLGIMALIVLVLGVSAYFFFLTAPVPVRIAIFVLILVAGCGFGAAVLAQAKSVADQDDPLLKRRLLQLQSQVEEFKRKPWQWEAKPSAQHQYLCWLDGKQIGNALLCTAESQKFGTDFCSKPALITTLCASYYASDAWKTSPLGQSAP